MKRSSVIIIMAAFAVLLAGQGICQQVIELKPPTEDTISGVIKRITDGQSILVSAVKGGEDVSIILGKDSKVTIAGKVGSLSDLRVGQTVSVTYTAQNTVPIVSNVPVAEETLRVAKTISIVSPEPTPTPKKESEVAQGMTSEQKVTVIGKIKVTRVQAIRGVDYELKGGMGENIGNRILSFDVGKPGTYTIVAPVVKVAEAKGEDGKVIASLKGKTLRVLGEKEKIVEESYENKEVIVQGTIKDGKMIHVTSVSERVK